MQSQLLGNPFPIFRDHQQTAVKRHSAVIKRGPTVNKRRHQTASAAIVPSTYGVFVLTPEP